LDSIRVAVIGAGGHAAVVIDTFLTREGEFEVIGAFDVDSAKTGSQLLGVPIRPDSELASSLGTRDGLFVAIGDNAIRRRLIEQVVRHAENLVNALHPAATISPHARLGRGVAVMAGAVINARAFIGDGVIVNTGATIDHDCVVENFAHIAPGVSLGGGVHVGTGSLIGIGASVLPSISVGDWSVVAAGAVVTKAVPHAVRVAGVPARDLSAGS
jgi:sugar O-acyltransferase (sialic acid O-acetyltransferase NeuD family)